MNTLKSEQMRLEVMRSEQGAQSFMDVIGDYYWKCQGKSVSSYLLININDFGAMAVSSRF